VESPLIRVAGRTDASHLKWAAKYPILLHKDDPYTRGLVIHYHRRILCHVGGVRTLLAELNKRYWIPQCVALVRKVIRGCLKCRRRDCRPEVQHMSTLPDYRVPSQRIAPFETTAIDVAGPFSTKQGKGKVRKKRWLVIFRCAAIAALHVEMLMSMDTDALMLALERFLSVRQRPKLLICDNGSNFVRASKEMRVYFVDVDEIEKKYRVEFKFQPPKSPSFNGIIETMVMATKRAQNTFIQQVALTDDELDTSAKRAIGILNNVPLA
jgi:hypothetical protein